MQAAKDIATGVGVVEHRIVRLPDLKEAGDIQRFRPGRHPPTYIPLRNGIFYAFAGSYAEETGAAYIVGGHNRDDQEVFEDVSPSFFEAMGNVLTEGSRTLRKNRVTILRPLQEKRKAEVVRLAAELEVPLGLTWSCHRDGDVHCWECPGCVSRRRSFQAAGIVDPLDETPETKIT